MDHQVTNPTPMSYLYTFLSVCLAFISIVANIEVLIRIAVGLGSLAVIFVTVRYHIVKIREAKLSIQERELRIENLKSHTK